MGLIQDSVSLKLWRMASSGSLIVALCRGAVMLPGQIGRGSRLLQVLIVEDYLDEDRGPLVELASGSRVVDKLLIVSRRFAKAVSSLASRDVQAFRLSRLNRLLSSADCYMSRLPAALFFFLFVAVFFLLHLGLSTACPDSYLMVPWSAGPAIGLLAALLIARSSRISQGRGVFEMATLGAKWCLRGALLLLKRIRLRLSVFLYGRGKTPVEGGPEI
jgi:hypothetical protein